MSNRALVGTRKGLFTIARGTAGWQIAAAHFVGDNVPMLLSDPRDGALYAVLSLGHFGNKLHRSTDGGATWQEVAVPQYPPKPEGEVDVDSVRQTPLNWSLDLVWSLEPGGADQPGTLWAGTVPGGLFRSDDRGESWRIVRALWFMPDRKKWSGGGMDRAGIHSIVVDPRDSRHVLVAVSTGGIWRTRDGGETWAVASHGMRAAYMPPDQAHDPIAQDVHRLVACGANPDVMWVQHHNGIFHSTDASASWREITEAGPSTFGFAAAAHPRDPQTAWFVPAVKDEKRIAVEGKVVVTRTRDGGRSFEVLRHGLPQTWAYDLVYRHGLDVDGTGTRLMFGSTTGNLWVSDDGGDRWSAISTNLPPIYCVRFAA